jgi:hypothetical protein
MTRSLHAVTRAAGAIRVNRRYLCNSRVLFHQIAVGHSRNVLADRSVLRRVFEAYILHPDPPAEQLFEAFGCSGLRTGNDYQRIAAKMPVSP